MSANARTILVLALAASLSLAGCVDSLSEDLESSSAEAGDRLTIALTANDAPEELAHVGFALDGVFVHEANTPLPDGFHEVALQSEQADVVKPGSTGLVTIAQGNVPAGTYDQILLRLSSAQVHGMNAMSGAGGGHDHGNASDDGHDHAGSDDGHDHGNASEDAPMGPRADISITSEPIDIPVNVTFEVPEDEKTRVELSLDAEASTEGGGFAPSFANILVKRGDAVVETFESVPTAVQLSASGDVTDTSPPVARAAVFGPDGAQVYDPDFLAEDGVFVNSKSSAFELGETLRFSGTDSEAVESGAEIESYHWDFDDGTTDEGATTSHAWDQPGVFEVTLTVTDSEEVTDTQTVRVIYLASGWTAELVNTSFEEGEGDWSTSAAPASDPAGELQTTWALDGTGRDTDTSWHVGHHLFHLDGTPAEGTPIEANAFGYTSEADATLTSPAIEIPANWSNAGYQFHIRGGSESCCDTLTITYSTSGGGGGQIGQFAGSQSWTLIEDQEAFADAAGQEVKFTFSFTSDGNNEPGPGWYLDDLVIGGVDTPLHKGYLLEETGHDGHDHEH